MVIEIFRYKKSPNGDRLMSGSFKKKKKNDVFDLDD